MIEKVSNKKLLSKLKEINKEVIKKYENNEASQQTGVLSGLAGMYRL